MSLSFTDAAMTYLGQQIGATNKVPAGQSFLIAIAIMEAEGDDFLFLIKGTYSNGAVSNLDKTFAEITAASGNDKVIVMKLTDSGSYYYLPCAKIDSTEAVFADDIESGLKVTLDSTDAVTVSTAGGGSDVFYIEVDLSLQTMQLSNLSRTYAEISAALAQDKYCIMRVNYTNPYGYVETTYGAINIVNAQTGFVTFNLLMLANFGSGEALYNFAVYVRQSGQLELTVRQITSTPMA